MTPKRGQRRAGLWDPGGFPHFCDARESPPLYGASWGVSLWEALLLYHRSGHFPQPWTLITPKFRHLAMHCNREPPQVEHHARIACPKNLPLQASLRAGLLVARSCETSAMPRCQAPALGRCGLVSIAPFFLFVFGGGQLASVGHGSQMSRGCPPNEA